MKSLQSNSINRDIWILKDNRILYHLFGCFHKHFEKAYELIYQGDLLKQKAHECQFSDENLEHSNWFNLIVNLQVDAFHNVL